MADINETEVWPSAYQLGGGVPHRQDAGGGGMPEFPQPLKVIASRFTGTPATAHQQAFVTEYAPGAGISWHPDKPMFEDVVGLSLLVPCVLRLRRKAGTAWERCSVQPEPRSAYLLHGAVREGNTVSRRWMRSAIR